MTNIRNNFWNANEAFEYFYKEISKDGIKFANTRTFFNIGFTLHRPEQRAITDEKRNWNKDYAEAEWQWYLTGLPNIKMLGEIYGKIPPIWERMANEEGYVNSNYGYQWERNGQLDYIVDKLKKHKHTRHAAISIYDGKEHDKFAKDTPCTYAVQFTNVENRLNMCVIMRSNDLWYGFCNDQYCFSKLQELVCKRTGLKMGSYFHFAHNLHIYSNKLGL